jgi:hypothetical protein
MDPDEADSLVREIDVAIRGSRTVQIYFGDPEVGRMREKFSAAAGQRLSANDVLCAHVVSTIRRLDEDQESRDLAVPVNLRRYLDLPPAIVGNFVGEVYLSCSPQTAPEALAADIRAGINDFARSHLSLRTSYATLKAIGRSRLRDCVPIGFDLAHRTFNFTSWRGFGVYDITFEGQQPILVAPATNIQLPWNSWLIEGFGNAGFFLTMSIPARLVPRLRSPDGRAALHRFRAPEDPLPALAGEMRKLI